VPILLESGSDNLAQIFTAGSQPNLEAIFRWDAQNQLWVGVTGAYQLLPLDALYVKVKAGLTATAVITPSTQISGMPSRQLYAGLNLVGPAPAYESGCFPAKPVNEAFVSIEFAPGGLWGYSMVVSPGLNQPAWTYPRGGTPSNVLPYKGYWVAMDNPDTLYGFSTTPLP
jgi:hypothetical protein